MDSDFLAWIVSTQCYGILINTSQIWAMKRCLLTKLSLILYIYNQSYSCFMDILLHVERNQVLLCYQYEIIVKCC